MRLWGAGAARAGSAINVPTGNHGSFREVKVPITELSPAERFNDGVWLAIALLAVLTGAVVLIRGGFEGSYSAGMMLLALSLFLGPLTFPPAAGPLWLSLTVILAGILATSLFPLAAFFMAQALLPPSVPASTQRTLQWVFGVPFAAVLLLWTLDYAQWWFTPFGFSHGWLPVQPLLVLQLAVVLVTMGIAAAATRGTDAAAVRMLFTASVVGFGAQSVVLIAGWLGVGLPPPAAAAAFAAWAALFAGYLYVSLAPRLVSIDFVVSRTLIYAILVALITVVLIFVDGVTERFGLGRAVGIALEVLTTLLVALTFRWAEQRIREPVEQLLYRDKIKAEEQFAALVQEFPHATDVSALARHVAVTVRASLNAPLVAIYLVEGDSYQLLASDGKITPKRAIDLNDPLFLRLSAQCAPVETAGFKTALPPGMTVFPLVLLGKVVGGLCCSERTNGEAYVPDERRMLTGLATELATATAWLRATLEQADPKRPRLMPGAQQRVVLAGVARLRLSSDRQRRAATPQQGSEDQQRRDLNPNVPPVELRRVLREEGGEAAKDVGSR